MLAEWFRKVLFSRTIIYPLSFSLPEQRERETISFISSTVRVPASVFVFLENNLGKNNWNIDTRLKFGVVLLSYEYEHFHTDHKNHFC